MDEHVAALAAGAATPQVADQRPADVDGQWQPVAPAALADQHQLPARKSISSSVSAATSPASSGATPRREHR